MSSSSLYAAGYFADDVPSPRVTRFAAFFTLFAGAMLGLVVAGDVWTLFVCWELTSVLSFLLIGLDDRDATARAGALRALLVTGAGGLAMLGGLLCLVHQAGSSSIAAVVEAAPRSTMGQVGLALVLVGAFSKSAQFPLHFWLPGAMAAPTPVSAYLHSATMVKAGVVLIARFAPAAAVLGWWRPLLVIVGGSTMLVGGVAALRRDDAKQSLAFGTVSQLGFLVLLVGVGNAAVTAAGVAWLVAHALFKCGAVPVRRRGRSCDGEPRSAPAVRCRPGDAVDRRCSRAVHAVDGRPPAAARLRRQGIGARRVGSRWRMGPCRPGRRRDRLGADDGVLAAPVVGPVRDQARRRRAGHGPPPQRCAGRRPDRRPGRASRVLLGLAAAPFASRLATATEALDPGADAHLTLWPGLHLPLLLSVAITVAGDRARRADLAGAMEAGADADRRRVRLRRAYSGLLSGARRLTTVTQSGSLPVYVAVVIAVVVVVLGVGLAQGAGSGGDAVLADSAMQFVVVLMAVALSIAVVAARRRFVSVLLLGGVGQAMTVLFLMYGAPDLALTQFMIETMGIVAFVLVLRHLPPDFSRPPSWAPRVVRIGLAVAAGVAVAWFAFLAGSVDKPTDVREAMEQLSLPAAGGRNVVNVAVIDFRGVDTMFEITVFGTAALGVANLVGAVRRRSTPPSRIGAHSMVFEQVTRMIFHLTLLASAYVALRGHNAPGGGFAGGLIAGAAFVFRILAGGQSMERPWIARLSPVLLIGTGILLAVGSGTAALIAGQEFLETAIVHVHLPWIGDVKLVSAAIFDFGVYLLVIGVVIIVLGNLASRTHAAGPEDRHRHEPRTGRPHRRARRHRACSRCCTAA